MIPDTIISFKGFDQLVRRSPLLDRIIQRFYQINRRLHLEVFIERRHGDQDGVSSIIASDVIVVANEFQEADSKSIPIKITLSSEEIDPFATSPLMRSVAAKELVKSTRRQRSTPSHSSDCGVSPLAACTRHLIRCRCRCRVCHHRDPFAMNGTAHE